MSENKEVMNTSKEKVLEWLNSTEAKAGKLEQEAMVSMIPNTQKMYMHNFLGSEKEDPSH